MARPSGPKTRCNNKWTEAKFRSFIKNQLRGATRKWEPIQSIKKKANVKRGFYLCASCKETVPLTTKNGRKRVKNVFVDHIQPIINPETGFTTWDECIDRMFCEEENLQLLCKSCHDIKSKEEREIAAKARKKNNE